jgi:hypothetical protein
MREKNKTAFLAALLVVLTIAALALPTALAGPKRYVYLTATFRDANTTAGTPLDKMRSDGQGPYVNAPFLTVLINDEGELIFHIDANSGRRSVFIYDDKILSYVPTGNCQELPPDTACNPYDNLPDEPVTYAFYRTNNGTSYYGPQVNLLTMQGGETAVVRIWIGFQTALHSGAYYSKYNRDFPDDAQAGIVNVTALDTNGDKIIDRWILSPIPNTDNKVNLHRTWQVKSKYVKCDIGCFRLPFELVLDRL